MVGLRTSSRPTVFRVSHLRPEEPEIPSRRCSGTGSLSMTSLADVFPGGGPEPDAKSTSNNRRRKKWVIRISTSTASWKRHNFIGTAGIIGAGLVLAPTAIAQQQEKAPAKGMFYQFVNNTKGKFSDDQISWSFGSKDFKTLAKAKGARHRWAAADGSTSN